MPTCLAGIAHASTTRDWRAAIAAAGSSALRSETAFELTGRHALSADLALLPHIHFVRNPGAVREQKDAWIIGLRLEATASHRFIFMPNQLSEET